MSYGTKASHHALLSFRDAKVGLGFLLAVSVRRIGSPRVVRAVRVVFVLGCVLAVEGARAYVDNIVATNSLLAAELIVLALAFFWNRFPTGAAMTAIFILWPLFPIIVGHQLLIRLTAGPFEDARPVPARQKSAGNGTRSVWLIFDELDQRVAFEQRPTRLRMTNLDRLRLTALYAPRATPPAWKTLASIPALITGQSVREAQEAGTDELMLTMQDGSERPAWEGTPNLFSKARSMGLRVGIVGWFHPYCRVAGEFADFCTWEEFAWLAPAYPWELRARSLTRSERMWLVLGRQLWAYPAMRSLGLAPAPAGWFSEDEYLRKATTETFHRMRRAALAAVADPNLDMVYVHWPIPHLPGLTRNSNDKTQPGYLENLELTDATVGEVRRLLEARGLWDRTLLLVSSITASAPISGRDTPTPLPRTGKPPAKSDIRSCRSFSSFRIKRAGSYMTSLLT